MENISFKQIQQIISLATTLIITRRSTEAGS